MPTSCLLDAVNSVIAAIGAIPYDWGNESIVHSRPNNLFQLVRMWNNQVNRSKDGSGYTFETPACFLELRPEENMQFLENVTCTDYVWRLHIVDVELDSADGNMDQNLKVYTYRDKAKNVLVGFSPPNCSTLYSPMEHQDYDHSDVYHYLLDLKSCFVDTKGSTLDPDQTKVIYKDPPTNLELDSEFDDGITPPSDPLTSYIWKVGVITANIVAVPDPTKTQTLVNGAVIPLEYALNGNGTLTIPYLASIPGIAVLTPFMLAGVEIADEPYDGAGTFDNSIYGGFNTGNQVVFNASLPMI